MVMLETRYVLGCHIGWLVVFKKTEFTGMVFWYKMRGNLDDGLISCFGKKVFACFLAARYSGLGVFVCVDI